MFDVSVGESQFGNEKVGLKQSHLNLALHFVRGAFIWMYLHKFTWCGAFLYGGFKLE